mgnify:CR=1 FL=1
MSTAHRGFATMDPALAFAIRSKGGRARVASGKGHQWTLDEARFWGGVGGMISRGGGRRKREVER